MIAPTDPQGVSRTELDDLRDRMQLRIAASDAYFERHAGPIAACAGAMADRFWDGATLLVTGSGAGATDAQHNAVEYVHPVLPGCRALPAVALCPDAAALAAEPAMGRRGAVWESPLASLARPRDILLAFCEGAADEAAADALAAASRKGLMTVALVAGEDAEGVAAEHVFPTGSPDPLVSQELQLATYHVLWELVHIILNHRGTAATEDSR